MAADRIRVVHEAGYHYSVCRCGARGEAAETATLCDPEPRWIPTRLIEPCSCPRCFSCQRLLTDDGTCDNLHCLNLGLHILDPE